MSLPWKQVKAFLGSCVKDSAFEILSILNWFPLISKSDDETLTLDLPATEIDLHIEARVIFYSH